MFNGFQFGEQRPSEQDWQNAYGQGGVFEGNQADEDQHNFDKEIDEMEKKVEAWNEEIRGIQELKAKTETELANLQQLKLQLEGKEAAAAKEVEKIEAQLLEMRNKIAEANQ